MLAATAVIPAADVSLAGTNSVTVYDPDQGLESAPAGVDVVPISTSTYLSLVERR